MHSSSSAVGRHLVVAVFSPAIYYWARASASLPGEIERSIEEVAVAEVPAH
ncbi:hypothetical protein ACFYOA_16250 [Streptomyces iakyrus]|uniref:hypothetical protein n=1 Tax=Streptomyces iakyrus TaxID=68219 RepID=UPI00368AABB3